MVNIPSIEYLKSSLSINTHLGCAMGCTYCAIQDLMPAKITSESSIDEIIENLQTHKLFEPNITPLSINNRTDPLHPSVKKTSLELALNLSSKKLLNPIILISKLSLNKEDLQILEFVENPVYFFVSFSNLPKVFEPAGHEMQYHTLETLTHRKKVRAIHYWRPIIKGYNDTEDAAIHIFEKVLGAVDATVLSGLRLNNELVRRLSFCKESYAGWTGDNSHKFLDAQSNIDIHKYAKIYAPSHPIFRHTSCAISFLNNTPDYNAHYLTGQCTPQCTNARNCYRKKEVEVKTLKQKLTDMSINSWNLEGNILVIDDNIDEQKKRFLEHTFLVSVKSDNIELSPSEKRLQT